MSRSVHIKKYTNFGTKVKGKVYWWHRNAEYVVRIQRSVILVFTINLN